MRVTQNTLANDIVANLNSTYANIATLSNELSSGKQLQKPSDNPSGVAYAIDLQASLDQNQQQQTTSQNAQNWLQSNETALQGLSNVLSSARQLAVQGANDTNATTDRAALATSIGQLIQQTQQISNSTYAGNYIFAGTMTQTQPFNALGGYSGNTSPKMMQIATGYSMQVNIDPTTAFSGANGVFNTLKNLMDHLNGTGSLAPATNVGTTVMSLGGSGYTLGGTPTNYQVQVTAVTAGSITGAKFSTDGGVTWTAAAGGPPAFTLSNGLTANFTNAAVTAAVGDQFNFTAVGTGTNFAITPTTNVGNEQATVTGNYNGSGAQPAFQARAAQLDSNNNVVAVQLSYDNGATWSTPLATTTGGYNPPAATVAGPANTPTTFDLGNGLQLNWTQSTINAANVATAGPPANYDTLSYIPTSTAISNDIGAIDTISATVTNLDSEFGAKDKAVQDNITQLTSQSTLMQQMLSQTEDADYTKLSTELASANTIFQAALAVDARSIEPSLVTFLH